MVLIPFSVQKRVHLSVLYNRSYRHGTPDKSELYFGTSFYTATSEPARYKRLKLQVSSLMYLFRNLYSLKLVVCILLRVLGQVQGFRLTQHWFEYFFQ
jgi:hypothetical protein